jgi:phosphate uptake regulator
METRKIQLIAGSTYSVSLPKGWVKKNSLKEKNEVSIKEQDRNLLICPGILKKDGLDEINLDVDNYLDNIDQVLFSIYYLGVEKINLYSKKHLKKETKSRIRKTLTHMSGTEISYEDKKKMSINVLLDKSKINIKQVIYRISMVLELSIENIIENINMGEIRINENEIDRLFHLSSKIISLSLTNPEVLYSSDINHIILIPSYFLISKKLENIGDNVNNLASHLYKNKIKVSKKKEILEFIKNEVNRSIRHILKDFPGIFKKIKEQELEEIKKEVNKISDEVLVDYIEETIRYVKDIEEEIVHLSFYNKLIKDKLI